MFKYNKNIFAFPLLTMVLMPMLVCVYFLVKQQCIKAEMEEKLEACSLLTITLLKKNIQWVEQGKELIVQGELFDVKEVTQKNDSLVISGLFDSAEKEIKQKLFLVLGNQSNTDKPLHLLITQFLYPALLLSQNNSNQLPIYFLSPKIKYFIPTQNTLTVSIEITTPPPNTL